MARFVYHNINPHGEHEGDCVVRAISLASEFPYELIKRKLWLASELYDCDCLCRFCYEHLIEDVLGYRKTNCEELTVGEFADRHPIGTYLVRVPNHLTCLIDGTCFDIWDCLDEPVSQAWEVR